MPRCLVFLNLLMALAGTSETNDWSSIKIDVTTQAELIAAFGSPDEVIATFPWSEWSAIWKKRPLTSYYVLRYRKQYSSSRLLVGPGGEADDVEVTIRKGNVGSVRWHYGGPSARAAVGTLRADPAMNFGPVEGLSHGGKAVTGGSLWVEVGPGDSTVEVLLQLK